MPRRSALETYCRRLSGDVSFGTDTLLAGCRSIELGKQPQGGVIKHCRINSTSIEGHTAVVDTSASKGAVRRAGTRIGQVRAQRRTRYYTASPGVCHFLGRNLLAG